MVMADVFAVVFTILGLFLALPAFGLLWRAFAPRVTKQAAKRYAQTPLRTVPIGILFWFILSLPGLLIGAIPVEFFKLVSVCWISGVFALAIAGLGGLAAHVGSTVSTEEEGRQRPWRTTLKGALILELTCLIPILGWFVLVPLLLASGLGAWMLGFIRPLREEENLPKLASPKESHAPGQVDEPPPDRVDPVMAEA